MAAERVPKERSSGSDVKNDEVPGPGRSGCDCGFSEQQPGTVEEADPFDQRRSFPENDVFPEIGARNLESVTGDEEIIGVTSRYLLFGVLLREVHVRPKSTIVPTCQ